MIIPQFCRYTAFEYCEFWHWRLVYCCIYRYIYVSLGPPHLSVYARNYQGEQHSGLFVWLMSLLRNGSTSIQKWGSGRVRSWGWLPHEDRAEDEDTTKVMKVEQRVTVSLRHRANTEHCRAIAKNMMFMKDHSCSWDSFVFSFRAALSHRFVWRCSHIGEWT